MKKIITTIIMTVVVLSANAQKLEKAKTDKFNGISTVNTSWTNISMMKPCYANVRMSKALNNGRETLFLDVKCATDNADHIDEKMAITMIDSEGEKHMLFPASRYYSSVGGGARGITASKALGFTAIYIGDMSFLSKTITDMRIETSERYYDFQLSPKESKALNKHYELITGFKF